jgi:hypothetical protein
VVLNKLIRSFGRPRAIGCASQGDSGNPIVRLLRISRKSMLWVVTWKWNALAGHYRNRSSG